MITYYLYSNVGRRDNNEDSVGMTKAGEDFCFVLADGLGGHGKGEEASRIAVERVIEEFVSAGGASQECLSASLQNAQDIIMQTQRSSIECRDMKTTCVVLHIGENSIQWGHVGDSRLYYFYKNKLVQRTRDHSVPQMLVDAGRLKEKHIRNHPDRNRLLKVMGIEWESPKFELGEPVDKVVGQAFLLCSDGFWELIDEKQMMNCLKKASSAKEWIEMMEVIVLKKGKNTNMDNYSAIAVWVE